MTSKTLQPIQFVIHQLNQFYDFVKSALTEHWFMTYSIGYWVMLLFLYPNIAPYFTALKVLPLGHVIQLILVLLIPGVLLYKRNQALKKKQGSQRNKHAEINTKLSQQHYNYLIKTIHKQQLDVFHEVLLVTLNMYYNAMLAVEYCKDEHGLSKTLFDLKFTHAVKVCQQVGKLPLLNAQSQSDPKKANAVLCFAFFRVFFNGLADAFKDHPNSKYLNNKQFIRHIPYKFILHLGSQNWRLYEFQQLCFGDLASLKINADISHELNEVVTSILPQDNDQKVTDTQFDEYELKQLINQFKKFVRNAIQEAINTNQNPGVYLINTELKQVVLTDAFIKQFAESFDITNQINIIDILVKQQIIQREKLKVLVQEEVIESVYCLNYPQKIKHHTVFQARILPTNEES